jgi:hypothetical protein
VLHPDAVLHYTKGGGLGSTFIRFQDGEEIVEGHRKAVEEYGLTWELLSCIEAEDLLTSLLVNVATVTPLATTPPQGLPCRCRSLMGSRPA